MATVRKFYFRTTDVTGNIKLPEGVEMVMPGDNIDMEITLITPIACEEGLRFRYPRRWPHGRIGRRNEDSGVAGSAGGQCLRLCEDACPPHE